MDALVAKTLNEDESYVDIEPPRTVKKVMNLVKHIATSNHDVRLKKTRFRPFHTKSHTHQFCIQVKVKPSFRYDDGASSNVCKKSFCDVRKQTHTHTRDFRRFA
jgi:hypothetical protein